MQVQKNFPAVSELVSYIHYQNALPNIPFQKQNWLNTLPNIPFQKKITIFNLQKSKLNCFNKIVH